MCLGHENAPDAEENRIPLLGPPTSTIAVDLSSLLSLFLDIEKVLVLSCAML